MPLFGNLPGATHIVQDNVPCEDHPDRMAVIVIQGETDSFGAEYHPACQECYDAFKQHRNDPSPGVCDWCELTVPDRKPTRNVDEGSCGRVYYVCDVCMKKHAEYIEKELASLEADNHDDRDDYPDDPSDEELEDMEAEYRREQEELGEGD